MVSSEKKRAICIVTGTRAEYGLLFWLMKEIQADPKLELQIIATGMHLSPEFGLTYKQIEADGFKISEKVEMLLSSDTPVGISKSVGLGLIGFADAFNRVEPDIVVLLGDRFEALAAAEAAMIARIPIAHIHGGETTEGVIDEAIRHSITKMAHIHFVASQPYYHRVIQLGETPDRVHDFGAIGLDNIFKLKLLGREKFEEATGFKLGKVNFLITYHPVTLNKDGPQKAVSELLDALKCFPNAKVLFTKTNADTDGRIINEMIENWAQDQNERAIVFTSLGQLLYLSAMSHVDVVIGNSSSGLIESPVLNKPTVNLGARQKGRLRAPSVLDCDEDKKSIVDCIKKALSREFKDSFTNMDPPYGNTEISSKIKDILKSIKLRDIHLKKFYDLANKHQL